MNTGNFPTNDIWLDGSIITNQSSRRLRPYFWVLSLFHLQKNMSFCITPARWSWECGKIPPGHGLSLFHNDHNTKPRDIRLHTNSAPSAHYGCYYDSLLFTTDWPPKLSPPSALYELYPVFIAALLLGHRWSNTHSYWCSFKSFRTSQTILCPSFNIITFIGFVTYGSFHIHHPNVISAFHLSSNCSFGTPAPSTYYPHVHMLLEGLCNLLCPQ